MNCCNKDKETPEKIITIRDVPIEEKYIQKIERRLLERKFDVLFEDLEGTVEIDMLEWKLELIGTSLSESDLFSELQFIEKFRKGSSYDLISLVLSYILLSGLDSSIKAMIVIELAVTSKINLRELITYVVDISCEVLPNLSHDETQINLYQISHYLTSLILCKNLLEKFIVEETGISALSAIDKSFENMLRQYPIRHLLESKSVRLLLFQESKKSRRNQTPTNGLKKFS